MILAGTLGNFFDRMIFHGVRDFLYFYWFEWPVFNVADCMLVVGEGLLLFQAFTARRRSGGAGDHWNGGVGGNREWKRDDARERGRSEEPEKTVTFPCFR